MKNNFTITQLVTYIKQQLSNDFILKNVTVTGEIGNFTNHFSGHWYFSLKDDKSLINCCMFKGYNSAVDFLPKNSDNVTVTGTVNVFERNGQLQLVITSMKLTGSGDFYKQFELTKQKLEPLGYFDDNIKKPIKKFNYRVCVITGANTAALQDIKKTISIHWPLMEIIECNALVQGQLAINSIVNAIEYADKQNADVIILARGGGSIDDLWCFNDESIAKAIYQCKTPLVTGIGHQIDTTIADLVADKRCATPTAAAELICPNLNDVIEQFSQYIEKLNSLINIKLNNSYQSLDYFNNKLVSYKSNIDKQYLRLDNYNNDLKNLLTNKIDKYQYLINSKVSQLINITQSNSTKYEVRLNNYITKLDSLSPLKTLSRGYIISSQNNKVIRSVKEIDYNSNIKLTYFDGTISAKINKE